MTNTGLLKVKVEKSGLKYEYLAIKTGITRFSLANKINNKNEFKASEISKLCTELNIETLEERDLIFFNK